MSVYGCESVRKGREEMELAACNTHTHTHIHTYTYRYTDHERAVRWMKEGPMMKYVRENGLEGVPVMAQGLRTPTSIHEEVDSIPGLTQWVRDPVLPGAVV